MNIQALHPTQQRAVINSAPIGIVLVNQSGQIVLVNSKAEEIFGYQPGELEGQTVEILLSASLQQQHIAHRADYLADLRTRSMGLGLDLAARRKDGTEFPVEIGLGYSQIEGETLITSFITDISERKRVETMLQETQRTLSTLMSNLPGMAYRCRFEPNWTMEFVSEGCFELTGYQPADLVANHTIAYGQLIHPDDRATAWQEVQRATENRQPFQLNYRLITATGAQKWAWEQGCAIYSDDGEILAIEGFVADSTERILAYQTLEQRVQERTHELEQRQQVAEGLRDTLATLNSARPLGKMLDYIVNQAVDLFAQANACAIYRLRQNTANDDQQFVIQASHGLPVEYLNAANISIDEGPIGQSVLTRQPVAIPDVNNTGAAISEKAKLRREVLLTAGHQAYLAVPLLVNNDVYGSLVLYYAQPNEFSKEDLALTVTFSDHAALAIENSRLRTQAAQTAVTAERNRLAHDLHDSVTQTLFSASVIADVLPRLWESNREEARRRSAELRELTRGALAEMRTLLLELRPAKLVEIPLSDLLKQLTEATIGRSRLPIALDIEGECVLIPDVQIAMYRITQEALNNIAKHAQAQQATVTLRCRPQELELTIWDDGIGFIMTGIKPENLGLSIMKERAEGIGARLKIQSDVGQGTQVSVRWQSKN